MAYDTLVNASDRSTARITRVQAGLLLLILLLAFGLRLYRIGAQSLWNDEGTSVALAQRDLATIARDAAHDIHPPLYYWVLHGWVMLTGSGEAAVRSLSALLGVVLVALAYALGWMLAGRWMALAAAFLSAINPFQVYYSQEARMYMLLAVVTAGAILALLYFVERKGILPLVALVALEAAGLYTHYSFFFVVLALNLAYALWLALIWWPAPGLQRSRRGQASSRGPRMRGNGLGRQALKWVLAQGVVLLLYLPWLPTAVRQVTSWPSPPAKTAFLPALANTWRWLIFGPTVAPEQAIVPLLLATFLIGLGAWFLAASRGHGRTRPIGWELGLLGLWLGLPVVLMFALGLYREAYLKFLLVTTPATTLFLAASLSLPSPVGRQSEGSPRLVFYALRFAVYGSVLVVPSTFVLHNYYTDPAYARDDYRSIAAYVEAMGRPGDAVLLNAPGQQEVFGYYYHGDLPVYPLPTDRPLDPAATETALKALAQPGGRVWAVLWATDESDPERFVEGWLDAHAYKALDSWYGDVRLVVYAVPERMAATPEHTLNLHLQSAETGDEITLLGYSTLESRLAAGDIAQITLFWRADRAPTQRYKVFVHVLDDGNHIVGQRDAEPGGGARLTTLWQPGEIIADHYGVPIHPATPPGQYRVEVGLYSLETGRRLTTPDGEGQVWLESLVVERPLAPAPLTALGMQHPEGADFDTLGLLGYDAYKLGFADQPGVALQAGDVLHVALYWRANAPSRGDWRLVLTLWDSKQKELSRIAAEPVSGYPTGEWQAGDVWRGQFNLAIPGDAPAGHYRLEVQPIAPDSHMPEPFFTAPLVVGP